MTALERAVAAQQQYARMRDDAKLRILRERAADDTLSHDERAEAHAEAEALAIRLDGRQVIV